MAVLLLIFVLYWLSVTIQYCTGFAGLWNCPPTIRKGCLFGYLWTTRSGAEFGGKV